MRLQEFEVNDYITLRLEDSETFIYVAGERFDQCNILLLDIPVDEIESFDEIESIDEIAERSGSPINRHINAAKIKDFVPPEVEFWAHCSNFQVWVENNYDTRVLHSNVAFPLLEKLTDLGDPVANRVFKEEIVKRFLSGHPAVVGFLFEGFYLDYLDGEEYDYLIEQSQARGVKGNYVLYDNRIIGVMTPRSKILDLSRTHLNDFPSTFDIQIDDITKIEGLEKLTDVKILNLGGNQITEIKGLDKLRDLKKLELWGNEITEIKGLDNFINLEELYLFGNEITEIKGLENLENLKELNLLGNKITEIKGLDQLTKLKILDLSRNNIKEIKNLDNLENLELLFLLENNINKIKGLEHLKHLKNFSIAENSVPKELLKNFGNDGQKYVQFCQDQIKKNN